MALNLNGVDKADVQSYDPMAMLASLRPVSYTYAPCPCGRRHYGFLPSPSSVVLADAPDGYRTLQGNDGIRIVRKDDEHMRVSEQELLSVLWNVVQQLSARVAELEGGATS